MSTSHLACRAATGWCACDRGPYQPPASCAAGHCSESAVSWQHSSCGRAYTGAFPRDCSCWSRATGQRGRSRGKLGCGGGAAVGARRVQSDRRAGSLRGARWAAAEGQRLPRHRRGGCHSGGVRAWIEARRTQRVRRGGSYSSSRRAGLQTTWIEASWPRLLCLGTAACCASCPRLRCHGTQAQGRQWCCAAVCSWASAVWTTIPQGHHKGVSEERWRGTNRGFSQGR